MRWFYDLSTKTKLFIGFGLITAMLSFVALYCLSVAAGSNRGLEETYQRRMSAIDLAQRAQIERVTIARNYRSVMLEKTDKRAAKMAELVAGSAKFARLVEELDRSAVDPAERQLVDEVMGLVREYGPAVQESVRISLTEPDKAVVALAASAKIGLKIAAILDQYIDLTKNATKDLVEAHMGDYKAGRRLVIAVLVASLGLAAWTVTAVGNAIARPMQQAIAVLDRVAAGDLTARLAVDRKDEIGVMAKTLNASLESVRITLSGVAAVLHETSAASTQLAASAHEISGGAQSQAASLEETAASLEEISATVKLNTDNAHEASNIASGARDIAERGGAVIGAAVSAMDEISRSSKRIADIIATIDEIAFQTNLLALNAAVEAARAGEQGRGFAVVATEVRSLAQRTGAASKEIRGLIAESSAKVEVGTRRVNESGKTLDEIVSSVKRVTDMVAEIAAASSEQNVGVDQVNTAVTQVDQVTQRNAAQTEQLSATASSLSDRSAYLQSLIDAFVLEDRSTKVSRKSPPPLPVVETQAHSVSRLVARPHLRKIAGGRRS